MRADGGDQDGLDGGVNNRTAGGQRVRRGTRRCRDNQPVRAVAANETAVDVQFQIDHARQRAFMHNRFVQHPLGSEILAVVRTLHVEQYALVDRGLASEDLLKGWIKLFERETGQKAEAAEIDGENGYAAWSGFSGGGQDGSVSAEHQQQFGVLYDLLAGFAEVAGIESARGLRIVNDLYALLFQPCQ